MRERVSAVCRICAVGCGTIVELDGERVVDVVGDPDDPWSHGYTCSKGRAGGTFHHHPDRFDVPLVRRGGELVTSSWESALDDIAGRLAAIVADHGPDAVADYTGTGGPLDPSGYALAESFMRNLGSHQRYSALSIDCPSKFLVPQLMAGVQLQFQPDLASTRLLLAVGVNTVVSHGHGLMMPNPLGQLRQVRARGGKVVVLDPRRSESARHADLHLAPRPGTDAFVLAHLVRQALRRGGDRTFLDACADEESVPRLAEAVEPFDTARTAATCDLSPVELESLDAMVAVAGRVSIETGTGVTMNRNANVAEWLVWALAAVTGSLDRPGGVTFNPGSLRRYEDSVPGGRGDLGPRPASRPDLRRLVNGEMPCAALADEIRAGHVRALLVRMGNPALAIAGQPALRDALAQLDVLVAVEARPTETTALATHVLPLADHFERGDVLAGYLQAQPFLRYAPAVVKPVGERRPQWWVFAELARRMGLPTYGSARRDAALAGRRVDDEAVAESITGNARRPWNEVRAAPYGIRDGSVAPGWLVPDRLPQRLDLAPAELVAQLHEASERPATAQLMLVNRRVAGQYNTLHRQVTRRGRPAVPSLLVHPDDAASRGLASGDTAVVITGAGSCRAVVEVTPDIRVGVVSLPAGFDDANVNLLTSSSDADPLSGMTVVSGLAVEVRRAG
ncbi:MAG TPA: molybdopterin-dependent oxidoreductase [Acidimicrobiales bacterium]